MHVLIGMVEERFRGGMILMVGLGGLGGRLVGVRTGVREVYCFVMGCEDRVEQGPVSFTVSSLRIPDTANVLCIDMCLCSV